MPQAIVGNARRALGQAGAAFYGHPSRRLRLIGVTGTDGKTTTIHFIHSILQAAGSRSAFVSTVRAQIGDRSLDTGLHTTTPDALPLQSYLAEMVAAGAEYAVLEVSSHSLDQERVAGCDFDLAVMTNLSHEHLDYHGTPERYLEAKARLFQSLAGSHRKPGLPKTAILNVDDNSYGILSRIPVERGLTYGLDRATDFGAGEIRLTAAGAEFVARTPEGDIPLRTRLLGRFNIYNALAAVAVAQSLGIGAEAIRRGVAAVERVPGRMETVDEGQGFAVLVDFAVTPNALTSALEVARSLAAGPPVPGRTPTPPAQDAGTEADGRRGKVIVMFGCAGLRDAEKRPIMGTIAGRAADITVITADDPRIEDLAGIMEQIAAGCRAAGRVEGRDYWKVPDRARAIELAIELAAPGDVVLLAGKGHERSLAIGDEELPWDEAETARAALQVRMREPLPARMPDGTLDSMGKRDESQ